MERKGAVPSKALAEWQAGLGRNEPLQLELVHMEQKRRPGVVGTVQENAPDEAGSPITVLLLNEDLDDVTGRPELSFRSVAELRFSNEAGGTWSSAFFGPWAVRIDKQRQAF